jgi:hypothetical protein
MSDSGGGRGGRSGSSRRNRGGGASGLLIALVLVVLTFASQHRNGPGGTAPPGDFYKTAWRPLGLTVETRLADRQSNCAAHSYGKVKDFFERTPCTGLRREQLTLGDGRGTSIRVLIYWVTMPTTARAASARAELAGQGTGDISALRGRDLDGAHYRSRVSGTTVVAAEAMAAAGHPSGSTLDKVADIGKNYPYP